MDMVQVDKAQYEEVMKGYELLKEKLAKEQDAIRKSEMDKLTNDIADRVANLQPKARKIIFSGEAKENELKLGFGGFLKAIRDKNPEVLKTVMEVQTAGQGGYTVPTGFATEILGALNNTAQVPALATNLIQQQYSVRYPSWLTDLSVSWVAEDGEKSLSKPTLSYATLLLKKMAVIVPFTDELLDDNIVDLQGKVTALVGENMGIEVERVALVGSTAAGDAFNGILNSGCNTTATAGASLSYEDLVDVMCHASLLERYRVGARWFMNLTVLKIVMKLKDLEGRPIWNMGNIQAGVPATLLGYPVTVSDQCASTSILFGNPKYILLGSPSKKGGITVAESNSAVAGCGASDYVGANAYLQDETWFRFVKRQSILVSVPSAYVSLTGVK